MTAADRIDAILVLRGIKAKQLADLIGLDRPQAIYDILHGKTKGITESMAIKIISAFPEINKAWLISGEGKMLVNETSKKIPLYNDVATIGGNNEQVANVDDAARPTEWVDAGDWFPSATSAIHH